MALQFGQQQQQARLYGPRQKNLSGLNLKTLAYPQAQGLQKASQQAASRLVPTPLQSRAQPYRQAATEQLRGFEASPPQFTMPMFPNPQVSDSYGDPALIGSPADLMRVAQNRAGLGGAPDFQGSLAASLANIPGYNPGQGEDPRAAIAQLRARPGTLGRFAANPELASFAERYRQPSAIEQRARYMG